MLGFLGWPGGGIITYEITREGKELKKIKSYSLSLHYPQNTQGKAHVIWAIATENRKYKTTTSSVVM